MKSISSFLFLFQYKIAFDIDLLHNLPYFPDETVEHIVHMSPVCRTGLVERTVELVCQGLALPHVHRPVCLLEVNLVGYQDDRNVFWGSDFGYKISVLHSLVETVPIFIESVKLMLLCNFYNVWRQIPVCNAVTDDETLSTSHILLSHRRKLNLGRKDKI